MKKILIKLIIITLMSIIPLASYNYIVDPYGVFNNSSVNLWYEPGYEPNQHYAKMRHLVYDRHSWDSYLFGSSRVGKIDPDKIPGGSYYNMNYSEGIIGEHLDDIKVLLQEGVSVKNVMIGLDNISYTVSPEDHRGQTLRHPFDASAFKRMIFQVKYLLFGLKNNSGRHAVPGNSISMINFNILGNGLQNLEHVDEKIESNIDRHINSDRFTRANILSFDEAEEDKYFALMDETIRDISEIIALSETHNFSIYFFLNPTHHKFYMQSNPFHYLAFKKKLSQVTDYWDFSGFNSITTDNYYYYETSHYRTKVGNMIVCKVSGCNDGGVPDDFGVYVTKDNAEHHLKKQEEKLLAAQKSSLYNYVGKK